MSGSPPGTGPFDTLLVANRGEIAVRVLRTARAVGLRTVAVFSDADAGAPHVALADTAVRLGPAPARESYLHVERVLSAARRSGAQAVHPGYGFLSERAELAKACEDEGLVFVGPTPEAIALMGDKAAAKRRMEAAGVPVLAGYAGEEQDDGRLRAEAEAVGYPLMVKAAAGGGGKGMRLVERAADLDDALLGARREALGAFGDGTLLLERALVAPRHVEVQVLADAHGCVVALGERDCSVQRRHQKVVEEAPSPAVDEALRGRMLDAGVRAAAEIGYRGVGTVEMLLGGDGTLAFLEMNTRLQVEHPVTEEVFGVDLVAEQLRVARGERLGHAQAELRPRGHAMEARLYAEDPGAGYLPQTGAVTAWRAPRGAGVRVDAGVASGSVVGADYDPLLAKVVASGSTREESRKRLADALDRTVCLGVRTNRTFLARVLRAPAFREGRATTAFLDEVDVATPPRPSAQDLAAVAGWLHLAREDDAARRSPGLAGWSSSGQSRSRQRLAVDGDVHEVEVLRDAGGLHVSVDGGEPLPVARAGAGGGVSVDGHVVDMDALRVTAADGADRVLVRLPHLDLDVVDVLHAPPSAGVAAGEGVRVAPMHGAVAAVDVVAGDAVDAGQRLVVLEAMKMEHAVVADVAGTVVEVVATGAQVATGDLLVRLEPAAG